jgi:hypothetical protein
MKDAPELSYDGQRMTTQDCCGGVALDIGWCAAGLRVGSLPIGVQFRTAIHKNGHDVSRRRCPAGLFLCKSSDFVLMAFGGERAAGKRKDMATETLRLGTHLN